MSHPNEKWLTKYLQPLVGGTITAVGVGTENEDEAWPRLSVTAKDGKTIYELEISQDEEGNGPGVIFGLPFPS